MEIGTMVQFVIVEGGLTYPAVVIGPGRSGAGYYDLQVLRDAWSPQLNAATKDINPAYYWQPIP